MKPGYAQTITNMNSPSRLFYLTESSKLVFVIFLCRPIGTQNSITEVNKIILSSYLEI